jgi:hypothetical protein
MRARVAGCAPLTGATAQHPAEDATGTATLARARGAISTLTGSELRAQLRAQQGCNRLTHADSGESSRVASIEPEPARYRWRVILADSTPFEVCCLPELTLAEMRDLYQGAAVEPVAEGGA